MGSMGKLEDFIDNIEKKEGNTGFDAEGVIRLFRQRVEDFYCRVEQDWLKSLIDSGKIHCTREGIAVTEESLGTYPMDEMVIKFFRFTIRLTPIGTILIGSPGRIDMTFEGKSRMLVLVDRRITCAAEQIVIRERFVDGQQADDEEEQAEVEEKPKPEYVWKYIDDPREYTYAVLDKESFQNLIVELVNGKELF